MRILFAKTEGSAVLRQWGTLLKWLAPAFDRLPFLDLAKMKSDIEGGTAVIFEVHGDAAGLMAVKLDTDNGDLVAWIGAAAGKINGGPKARLGLIRVAMAETEKAVRIAGCKEVRVYGRNFARILPDYEPFEGVTYGLRKVLQ